MDRQVGHEYNATRLEIRQLTEDQRKAAALMCAEHCTDPDALKYLLKMLGLMDVGSDG